MTDLVLDGLRRTYGATVAVDRVDLEVAQGELVALLGPSGCGKTTTLRAIAGLETPTDGTIRLNSQTMFSGRERLNIPAEKRGVSMVFQSYAIWPHMTVFENMAYGLKMRRFKADADGAEAQKDGQKRAVVRALDGGFIGPTRR